MVKFGSAEHGLPPVFIGINFNSWLANYKKRLSTILLSEKMDKVAERFQSMYTEPTPLASIFKEKENWPDMADDVRDKVDWGRQNEELWPGSYAGIRWKSDPGRQFDQDNIPIAQYRTPGKFNFPK